MRRALAVILATGTIATAFLFGNVGQAFANHIGCGDTITQDTTLDSDLIDCPGDGIVVSADSITLDLNGHSVDGDAVHVGAVADLGIDNSAGFDDVEIKAGSVTDFDDGIGFTGAGRNLVLHIRVSRNNVGMRLSESDENQIVSSSASANDYAIRLFDSDGNRIEDTLASDSPGGNGIQLGGSSNVISGNRVSNVGIDGITVRSPSAHNLVEGNVISGSGENGIHVEGSHNVIRGNHISSSSDAGIFVETGRRHEIKENVISENVDDGIFVLSSLGTRIEHNVVSGNERGIWVVGSQQTLIEQNAVAGNQFTGVALIVSDHNGVKGNSVVNNGEGISLGEADNNRIEGNLASWNGSTGVAIRFGFEGADGASDHNVVAQNAARGNAGDGIFLDSVAIETGIRRNIANRNGDDGIDVESSATTLNTNTANNNADLGIEAVPGVSGGGNRASGNGNPLQCLNVACK